MNQQMKTTMTLAAIGLLGPCANAATIVYVGNQDNIDSQADDGTSTGWHSTTGVKPLDIDGDNALGTDGWHYSHTSGTSGLSGIRSNPIYATSSNAITPHSNATTGDFYDAPTSGTPGINPASEATISSWAVNSPTTTPLNIISFTIGDASLIPVGETLRIGLLYDSRGGTTGTQVFTIAQTSGTGGGTAFSSTLTFNDDGLDAAFFDLNDLVDGDTFQISSTAGASSSPHLNGYTFDTGVVPEPSTTALLGLGGLALMLRRRK